MLDLTLALRHLRLQPAFALAAIVTLALGIGANTAIFSLVNGMLLEPLPYEQGDRLVVLRQWADETARIPLSIAEFLDYRDQSKTLDLVEYHSMSFTLLGQDEPERVSTGVVSHNFFNVLGVKPAQGRFFTADDEGPGAPAVLVLSYGYWQRSFGGDPAVVGKTFEMNNRPHTVIGVLPQIPQFPNEHDVYMPTSACPFRAAGSQQMHENRGAFRSLTVFGRLRDGADLEAARAETSLLAERFEAAHQETYGQVRDFGATTEPLREELTRGARPMLIVLLATSGLVLLLACFNVANMTLARMLRRRRELAVRAALGADRWRLARQTATEAAVLSLLGGVLGLLVASASLDLLKGFLGGFSPRASSVTLDLPVLLFTLALSLATGLLFGAAPLFSRQRDLTAALRDGGHGLAGGGKTRVRGLLVMAQVAISAILLIGAGLLLRSFERLQNVDPGFTTENVLTARLALNWSKYDSPEKSRELFDRILERLDANPGVLYSAVGSAAPLTQQGMMSNDFRLENQPPPEGPAPMLDLAFVSKDYFRALDIPVLFGRAFELRDDPESPQVAVINRSFAGSLAERHGASQDGSSNDLVGRRLSLDGGETWIEIVGVVGDVRQMSLDKEAADQLYLPLAQNGFSNRLIVRTRTDPATMAHDLAAAVHAVDPQQPVERIETLEATRRASLETPRTTTWLLSLFALLALAVTLTGVASVIAWSVGQRTREIGLRMALGARRGEVLRLILRQGLTLIAVGTVVGVASAFFFSRLLADLLFETSLWDAKTLFLVPALLLGAGLVACWLPARRAVDVDPNIALRSE